MAAAILLDPNFVTWTGLCCYYDADFSHASICAPGHPLFSEEICHNQTDPRPWRWSIAGPERVTRGVRVLRAVMGRPIGASARASPKDQLRVSASAARRSPRSTSTSAALTAASMLRSAQKRSDFGLLLRPILVEQDRDHDHRAGRNRQRADHRQLFEDSDNACPPANSLPMREAPPCHTHTEPPFGPQQQYGLSVSTSARRQ